MTEYSFNPEEPSLEEGYNFYPTELPNPVSGDIARKRAQKFHIALGPDSPGIDTMANSIALGEEPSLRDNATQALAKQEQARATEQVIKLVSEGTATPEIAQRAAISVATPPRLDPNTALEKSFADRYMSSVLSHDNTSSSVLSKANEENPKDTIEAIQGANLVAAQRELARKAYEDTMAKYQSQGWLEWSKNVAKGVLPLMQGVEMSPDYNPLNILLPGSSLAAEREKFYSFRDLSISKQWLDNRVNAIAKENPNAAVDFARAMVELPEGKIIAGNLFGVFDVQNVGGVAVAVGKAGLASYALKKMLRDTVRDGIGPSGEVSAERTAAALGDIKTAANERSARQIFQGMDPAMVGHEVSDQMVTIMKPQTIESPVADALTRERTQRILPQLEVTARKLMESVDVAKRAPRLPPEVLKPMQDHASEMIDLHYPSVNHGVLDTRSLYEQASNTWYAEHIIGTKEGLLFNNIASAQRYAEQEYGLNHGSFSIKSAVDLSDEFRNKVNQVDIKALETKLGKPLSEDQNVRDNLEKISTVRGSKSTNPIQQNLNQVVAKQQGSKYYLSIIKPFDETHMDSSRRYLITTDNTNPVTLGNWVFSMLGPNIRSAEDQLAKFQRDNRHLVTHVPQEIQRRMVEVANLAKLPSKESHNDLEVILRRNADYVETLADGTIRRGRAYGNQVQLEKEWLDAHKRLPTDQESLAYWSYHQLMATDWMIRNFGVHRDLARQGTEQFSVKAGDRTVSFPGRFEKAIPWDSKESFGILVADETGVRHYWKGSLSQTESDMLKTMTTGEHKVLQVGNVQDRPFSTPGVDIGNSVHFVVTKNFETKPLSMNLVDWNPGVHIVYPQSNWVKQAIVAVGEKGILRYYGDRVLFAMDTEAEGRRVAAAVNAVQKMIKDGATDAELNTYISKHLPKDADYWKDKFNNFLTMDMPVSHTFSNKSYFEHQPRLRPENMVDETKSDFNLFRSVNMDFLANRNGPLSTVVKDGSIAGAPMYKLEKARTIDPFEALSRGLNNGVRALIVNDSKISAIEQWAAQYAHLAEVPDFARANPWSFFYDFIKLKESLSAGESRLELASAKGTRARILQFLGTASEKGRDLNLIQQKLMNDMSSGMARYYNDHELKMIKDPIAFTRSWMTHFRFGFFNIDQYVVQGMGAAHALAVAGPVNGWKGMAAYATMRAAYMTEEPAVLNRLASIASKLGWKKDQWLESYNLMRNVGLDIIGREHSMRYEAFDPSIFTSTSTKAASISLKPFSEGEKLTRMVAWNAAYQEFRKANPTKVIDQFDIPKILTRADDLSSNMTKASHSTLQEGWFQIPTQFYTFSQRMMEQFWGGRLTGTEKARAFATHAALFGIPTAAAIGIPWPFYDSLKQHMMDTGNPVMKDTWYKMVTEGFLSFMASHIMPETYKDTNQLKEYNISSRYGPGFSDVFKKYMDGEVGAIEAVGGATGSFLKNVATSVYPFVAHTYVAMMDKDNQHFPLTKDDIMGVIREISSVNNVHNAIYATNTGKYLAKNGQFVADGMTIKDAAAMLMGLTRTDITDTRLMIGTMKDQAEAQRKIQSLAEREFRRAFQSADPSSNNDLGKFEMHIARAKALMIVLGDFRDDQITETLKRAVNDNESQVQRIRTDFANKGFKQNLPGRLQFLYNSTKGQ